MFLNLLTSMLFFVFPCCSPAVNQPNVPLERPVVTVPVTRAEPAATVPVTQTERELYNQYDIYRVKECLDNGRSVFL